jgi:hypothetical protein
MIGAIVPSELSILVTVHKTGDWHKNIKSIFNESANNISCYSLGFWKVMSSHLIRTLEGVALSSKEQKQFDSCFLAQLRKLHFADVSLRAIIKLAKNPSNLQHF